MTKNNKVLAILGANILALVGTLMPQAAVAAPADQSGSSTDQRTALNAASLKSMESSWIQVPHVCKARGFHADPTPALHEVQSAEAQAVYGSIEA